MGEGSLRLHIGEEQRKLNEIRRRRRHSPIFLLIARTRLERKSCHKAAANKLRHTHTFAVKTTQFHTMCGFALLALTLQLLVSRPRALAVHSVTAAAERCPRQ